MDIGIIQKKIKSGKYVVSFTHTEKVRLKND